MLTIKNLNIKFITKTKTQTAVAIKQLSIKNGEVLALLGESGSGKSLTSLAIMGLLPDTAILGKESEIIFQGQDISLLPEVSMRKIRGKKIAMIFQEPMTALNPVMTVGRQVAEILLTHKLCKKVDIQHRVIKLFEQVELERPQSLYNAYPHQLSGGMKQRVMIAMALACEPELLIADEPTSALDVVVQYEIISLLKKLQQERGLSILFITHDITVVKRIADQVAVMYAGALMEVAPNKTLFQNPQHPYTQGLLKSLPTFAKRHKPLQSIEGNVASLTEAHQGCEFYQRCQLHQPECLKAIPIIETEKDHKTACVLYKTDFKHIHTNPALKELTSFAGKQSTANASTTVLELNQAKVYFPIKKGFLKRTVDHVKAVDDITLKLTKGKTTAIVGESGCGKTTLAKALLGLIPLTAGEVIIAENNLQRKKLIHKYIQIIFQDPFSSLNPRMLVGDIIAEGMRALKLGDKQQQQDKIAQLIAQMGLPQDSAWRYPHEFSGGQRQRICIARALAVNPEVIICDEPTSALDVSIQAQIINLLKSLQQQQQLTYLFITHNMALVAYMADEIVVMRNGKVVEQGSAEDVIQKPKSEYTKALISAAEL